MMLLRYATWSARSFFGKKKVSSAGVSIGAKIGRGAEISKNVSIDKMCCVGNYTYIGQYSTITRSSIGNFCSIGVRVLIGPGSHDLNRLSTSSHLYSDPFNTLTEKSCTIGSDVWVGSGAVILRGVNIGNGAVVGANSVVTRDVEPYSIVAGNPARHIRYRLDGISRDLLMRIQWESVQPEQLAQLEQDLFAKN